MGDQGTCNSDGHEIKPAVRCPQFYFSAVSSCKAAAASCGQQGSAGAESRKAEGLGA